MYISYWLTFFVNKSIIYQDAGKKRFLLYYLEKLLTRSLFLYLDFLLKSIGLYAKPIRPIFFLYSIL